MVNNMVFNNLPTFGFFGWNKALEKSEQSEAREANKENDESSINKIITLFQDATLGSHHPSQSPHTPIKKQGKRFSNLSETKKKSSSKGKNVPAFVKHFEKIENKENLNELFKELRLGAKPRLPLIIREVKTENKRLRSQSF